jgi:hypothetical protein
MGEWKYSPSIPDPSIRSRGMVTYTPRPLYPREEHPCTRWIGGSVSRRADLDATEKRKILALLESNRGRPDRRLSVYRLSDPDTG